MHNVGFALEDSYKIKRDEIIKELGGKLSWRIIVESALDVLHKKIVLKEGQEEVQE